MPGHAARWVVSVLGVVLLLVAATLGTHATPDAQQIPDRYIVVLQDDVANPPQVANEMAQLYGLSVSHVYEHALKGFAAYIPPERLTAVRADPRVRYISEDREVEPFGQAQPALGPQAAGDLGAMGASGSASRIYAVWPHSDYKPWHADVYARDPGYVLRELDWMRDVGVNTYLPLAVSSGRVNWPSEQFPDTRALYGSTSPLDLAVQGADERAIATQLVSVQPPWPAGSSDGRSGPISAASTAATRKPSGGRPC